LSNLHTEAHVTLAKCVILYLISELVHNSLICVDIFFIALN